MNNYTPPKLQEKSFTCPHCETFAVQNWSSALKDFDAVLEKLLGYFRIYSYEKYARKEIIEFIELIENNRNSHFPKNKKDFQYSHCSKCEDYTIWRRNEMIYPLKSDLPEPNKDMPNEVKKFYNEARSVMPLSPRSSINLLSIALEKLLDFFEEKEKKQERLVDRIDILKNKDISDSIIKKMHLLRKYRNEAGAHLGKLDLKEKEEKETISELFEIMNFVIQSTISIQKTEEKLRKKFNTKK